MTLSGGGTTQILSTNAGWEQQWPQLVVQNLTFTGAYSGMAQTKGSSVNGGGAIFDEGGQLKVVDSAFVGDSCYAGGPDLDGGAIRAVGMYPGSPVYITDDTFRQDSCSNGGAIYTDGAQYNLSVAGTVMRGNTAREGGGGIFFVVDSGGGTLQITSSTLHDNLGGEFQNAPGIFDSVKGHEAQPVVVSSSIG